MDEDEYSELAKAADDLFVGEYTSHIFYVEDTSTEAFYERLFLRLFPKLSDFRVACLHGKENIRKKVAEKRLKNLTYVFVVDKDFDDLLDEKREPAFVYLDRYSIENYLASLPALVRVLVEEYHQDVTYQNAMAACDDSAAFLQNLEDRLVEVTRYFVVSRRFMTGIRNTKIPVVELIEGSNEYHPMPTVDWIADYRAQLIGATGLPELDVDAELANAFAPSRTFPEPTLIPLHHVPGKHYFACILKYLAVRTKAEFETKVGSALHLRVLNHISLTEFAQFKARLLTKHQDLQAAT
jgi:hypothetical protein